MFKHNLVEQQQIERTADSDGVRFYQLPDGTKLQSVTKVLQNLNKGALDKWKNRVGQIEADRIRNKAAGRGMIIHGMLEKYLLNETDYLKDIFPIHKETFFTIKREIDQHVSLVYAVEAFLYSRKYKVAGTADLICEWDGVPTIVDFKTSERWKKEEYILSYLYQSTIYGIMVKELYPDIDIAQIAIIIAIDGEPKAQPFIYPFDKYYKQTDKFFKDHARLIS